MSFVHRCPWQPADYALENTMSSLWANFITTGNPNGKGLPEWPAYNTKSNSTMIFNEASEVKPLPGKDCLDFLINEIIKSDK